MTILDFQETLKKEIGSVLSNSCIRKDENCNRISGVNTFKQDLPIIMEDDEDVSQFFPYAIVRVLEGNTPEDDEPWIVTANILLALEDNSTDRSGYLDIMGMIQRVIDRFVSEPRLNEYYRALQDIEWAIQDEDTYPYYFGGVQIKFYLPKIGRREPDYG